MVAAPARRNWLFVDAAASFGGHEAMLLRWVEELQRGGGPVQPRLLAREGSRLHESAPPAVRAPALPSGRWRELKALRRALREEAPEWVVFASGSLAQHMLMVAMARLWGARVLVYVPLLDTFEAMGYRQGRLKDRFVRGCYAWLPQGWVAITAAQATHFQAWARPVGPVHLLPNTVAREIEDAPTLALREDLEPGERLRVLILGRLDAHQKGLDLLLRHLEAAPQALRDRLSVVLVGEGAYGERIEARRRANPALAGCLALQPWMPAREALAAHDVLLLTSRYEGVPLVMLEAMALGLPVVASDLPGVRAHLAPEFLFPVGDLARAMQRLDALRPREARERAAALGRAAYEAGASSAAFAVAVAALTQQVRIVGAAAAARRDPVRSSP